jgi:hypothetical protein
VGASGIRLRVGKSAGHFVQGAEDATIIDQGDATITTQRVVFQGGKYTREWAFSKLIGVMEDAHRPWIAIQVSNRQKTSGIAVGQAALDAVKIRLAVATGIFQGESVQVTQELRQELAELDGGAEPDGANGERAVVGTASDPVTGPPEDPAGADPPVPTTPEHPPKTEQDIGAEGTDADPSRSGPPPGPSVETAVSAGGLPPLPPPMWASDPSGRHEFRYWDGADWTDYVSDRGQTSRDPLDAGKSPTTGESI